MLAVVVFSDGDVAVVTEEQVEHLRPAKYRAYQVAINVGRPKRKGKPYVGGSEERGEDGYFHGPETCIILTYKSDLDLQIGDPVVVPLANHHNPRQGIVLASSSSYEGDLKEIYGLFLV